MSNELKIFTGTANTALTHEICEFLRCALGQSSITRFSDGELYFQILENVRGADVFIVQPSCPPVDSNLMELFLMIDAFKRASAKRITATPGRIGRISRAFRFHPNWFPICWKNPEPTGCSRWICMRRKFRDSST